MNRVLALPGLIAALGILSLPNRSIVASQVQSPARMAALWEAPTALAANDRSENRSHARPRAADVDAWHTVLTAS